MAVVTTNDLTHPPATGPRLSSSVLLAFVGGYLDGFVYLQHGHVFANAMTGNVVLLGLNCFSGAWRTGLRHLPPIVMFLLGISAARGLLLPKVARSLRNPYLAILGFEMLVFLVLSLQPSSTPDFWFTTTIAFVASMQVESFNTVHGHSYNSTFTTGNLRTLSEGIFDWFFRERDSKNAELIRDFAAICVSFGVGAMVAGFCAARYGNKCLWLEILLLGVVAVRVVSPQRDPQ